MVFVGICANSYDFFFFFENPMSAIKRLEFPPYKMGLFVSLLKQSPCHYKCVLAYQAPTL